MTAEQFRCSAEALAREEPVYATASLVSAWLLIEQPGAWGPDALSDSKFPDEIGAELQRRGSKVRILLIRHRSKSKKEPVYFKAYSGSDGMGPSLVKARLSDPEALLDDVDFEALANGDTGAGVAIEDPLYLVCTHGRHDICCADKGRPLYRALSALRPDRTWEVSHLGGDRFAANLLVLPRGDYFGRVEPEAAESLVSGYESGRLELAHHRGRSSQPRLVQAAEHFVRDSQGLAGFDDLIVTEYKRPEHDRGEVVFREGSSSIRVEVLARQLDDKGLLTCRAEQSRTTVAYELVSLTRE